jgi:hypothetical protein
MQPTAGLVAPQLKSGAELVGPAINVINSGQNVMGSILVPIVLVSALSYLSQSIANPVQQSSVWAVNMLGRGRRGAKLHERILPHRQQLEQPKHRWDKSRMGQCPMTIN